MASFLILTDIKVKQKQRAWEGERFRIVAIHLENVLKMGAIAKVSTGVDNVRNAILVWKPRSDGPIV
ncbi:MAG: hypothetical protein AAGM36_10600 [Cyanobacteria bacterium J06597_1]